nr:immunoglobulin light chain junction region [Macaca mulatta]
CIQGTHLPWTF